MHNILMLYFIDFILLLILYYTLKGQFKFASESDVLLTEHDKKVWQLHFM